MQPRRSGKAPRGRRASEGAECGRNGMRSVAKVRCHKDTGGRKLPGKVAKSCWQPELGMQRKRAPSQLPGKRDAPRRKKKKSAPSATSPSLPSLLHLPFKATVATLRDSEAEMASAHWMVSPSRSKERGWRQLVEAVQSRLEWKCPRAARRPPSPQVPPPPDPPLLPPVCAVCPPFVTDSAAKRPSGPGTPLA